MSELTRYTKGEEFVNASTHAIGALLSIYGIVMLAAASRNALEASSTAIFGATLFILFQSSTLYPAMVMKLQKSFSKNDHSCNFSSNSRHIHTYFIACFAFSSFDCNTCNDLVHCAQRNYLFLHNFKIQIFIHCIIPNDGLVNDFLNLQNLEHQISSGCLVIAWRRSCLFIRKCILFN